MKRYFALFLVVLASFSDAFARGGDDDYIQIFNLIAEADSLNSSQPEQAAAKYREAQSGLQNFQKNNPNWSPSIIQFRLDYVTAKLSSLSGKVPPPAPPAATPAQTVGTNVAEAVAAPAPVAAKPSAPADWDNQLNLLREQVRQLQADKSLLEAKVKEAFSARPAESDPRELARSEEKLKALQKENDLLKVSLASEKAKPASAADPKALEQSRQALAEANRQLEAQTALVTRLGLEKEALQSRTKALATEVDATSALRAENQLLKKQLASLQAGSSTGSAGEPARQLAQTQAQAAVLQSDKELLKQQLGSATIGSSVLPPAEESSRIKELERERDDLQKRLTAANKAIYGRKGKALNDQFEQLELQNAGLRARLDIFEARSLPYTTEELAMLSKPEPKLAAAPAPAPVGKSFKELTPTTAALVADARRSFQAGDLAKAEAGYVAAAQQDPGNAPMLADLASIQLEANHVELANTNIQRALQVAPENAYVLSVLGRVRLRQGKFDEALDALGRAAKLEPRNAEVQNFLGLTLSQKGLRGPAEAALRKALELEPNYASAHNNLAVVYVTGRPPATQLARWHYQRALAAGAPHNAELEKLLGLTQ